MISGELTEQPDEASIKTSALWNAGYDATGGANAEYGNCHVIICIIYRQSPDHTRILFSFC